MTPRWMTIEKLVAELGGVCRSQHLAHSEAESEHVADDTDAAVQQATEAVTSLLLEADDDESVIRDAWCAIAAAQDVIARLRETIAHSRALREQAQQLQDESLRLRRRQAAGKHGRAARREASRD